MQVKPERTGWRDLRLSKLHRTWGWDCPMVDIDFLGVEYNHKEPFALIEYKHENWELPADVLRDPNFTTLRNTANRMSVPFFLVRYSDDFTTWIVRPLNDHARTYQQYQEIMSQQDYVRLLYRIRDIMFPPVLEAEIPTQMSLFGHEQDEDGMIKRAG